MAARSCPKAAALTISKRSRTRGDRSRRRSTLSTSARCSVVISSMLVSFTDCYPPPLPQGYDSLHKLTNTYLAILTRAIGVVAGIDADESTQVEGRGAIVRVRRCGQGRQRGGECPRRDALPA